MKEIIPDMVSFLEESGRLESWRNFMICIKGHKMPSDNIALQLFCDVADWYSHESVTSMRYSRNVKRFWALGYKLFQEKFIRFMGGPKTAGQNCAGGQPVKFGTSDSKVNFITPSRHILKEEINKSDISCEKPCFIKANLQFVNANKSCKLCIDGKKLNSGFGKSLGDVIKTRK
jgi:hypothetical protein